MRADGLESFRSFPPILGRAPRVLVLGSMPSPASIAAGGYYGHPRNLFWPIMGELFGAGPELPYGERVRRLQRAGVAVWDVAHRCLRRKSADSSIAEVEPNDVPGLLARRRTIRALFFNGRTPAALFERLILPELGPRARALPRTVLPSTSPANASIPPAEKLRRWRALRDAVAAPHEREGPPAPRS